MTLTPPTQTSVTLTGNGDDFVATESGIDEDGEATELTLMMVVSETDAMGDNAWELKVTTSDELIGDSTVTITISSGSDHRFTLASAVSITVDRTGPTVTFAELSQSVKPNEAATVTITVAGAGPLETLELSDIMVIQTTAGGTASVLAHTFNSTTEMVTFTPTAEEGSVIVTVKVGAIADEFENMNIVTASNAIPIRLEEIDTTAPSVTIEDPVLSDNLIVFKFKFTEVVTFRQEHIEVVNATFVSLVRSSINDREYTLTVDPDTLEDDVIVTLKPDVVKDDEDNAAATATKTYTPPVMVETISVPAGGYIIITHANAASDALPPALPADSVVEYSPMVDLENLLYTGGTIDVFVQMSSRVDTNTDGTTTTVETTPKVVVNEVMWGVDEGHVGGPGHTKHQWIELYNTSADVAATALVRFRESTTVPATSDLTVGEATFKFKDRLSNIVRIGATTGWQLSKGQSGNSTTGSLKEFISMYRNDQNKIGWDHDHWTESILLSHVNHKSTPGAANTRDAVSVETRATPTTFNPSKDAVIINEVYNDADDKFDWIELRFLKTTNLENWTLSYTESDFIEHEIMHFPKREFAEGTILLIVNANPRDTNLAAGQNVTEAAENQARGAGPHKYWNPSNGDSSSGHYLDIPKKAGDDPDGDFLLILRTGKGWERFGSRDRIHDVVGTGTHERKTLDANTVVREPNTENPDDGKKGYIWNTRVWPLNGHHNIRDAHGDHAYSLLANGRNLAEGKVWRRNGTNQGWQRDGGDHIGFQGGLGYDRGFKGNGSPGYENSPVKGKTTELDGGRLVISELMLATDNGRFPQWIELHNTSKTKVVDLASDGSNPKNGWQMIVENHNSGSWKEKDRPLTITFNLKDGDADLILPNQTILIVADKVRGLAISGASHFPDYRVISVWEKAKDKFKMASRKDAFLNAEGGFYIKIVDGDGEVADEIGNLDGIAASVRNDIPLDDPYSWNWSAEMVDNRRTSLIRIRDEDANGDNVPRVGVPDRDVSGDMTGAVLPMGTSRRGAGKTGTGEDMFHYARYAKHAWVHTSDTKLAHAQTTWYGSNSDYGTPGHTTSTPLPVSLSYFRPTLENGEVVIRWTTESELDNAGFNILRSDSRNGEFKQVNSELVQGAGTTGERNTYKWVDESAKLGVIYYYQIEDVSFAGEHQTLTTTKLKGLISAKNKLTTLWGGLKEVQ